MKRTTLIVIPACFLRESRAKNRFYLINKYYFFSIDAEYKLFLCNRLYNHQMKKSLRVFNLSALFIKWTELPRQLVIPTKPGQVGINSLESRQVGTFQKINFHIFLCPNFFQSSQMRYGIKIC
jgi:hypothetical protein